MWVAAASFFWGPPNRVPEVIRIPALQAVAVLVPIVAMLYWLWRVRVRRSLRGIVRQRLPPRLMSSLRVRAIPMTITDNYERLLESRSGCGPASPS